MLMRKAIACAFMHVVALLFPLAASAQVVVWTDENANRIQRKDVSSGGITTIAQFDSNHFPLDVHYEPLERKLYYRLLSEGSSSFRRCDTDGSDTEIISSPSAGTFTINVEMRKLHWIESLTTVFHSSLDGSDVGSHSFPACCVRSLEAIVGDLYFMTSGTMPKGVWRADSDGSNAQLLHNAGSPGDLAFDPFERKVYFSSSGGINRINMDGTGFQQIVHLPQWEQESQVPDQIEVDYSGRKLYWIDSVTKLIQRSDLDGSNIENLVTAAETGNPSLSLRGLTIIQSPSVPALSSMSFAVFFLLIAFAGATIALRRARLSNST